MHRSRDLKVKYNIIQIVPRRTNKPDGVGDYATLLAHALLERTGGKTLFVSGTPARHEPARVDGWQTAPVLRRSGRVLAEQLSAFCRNEEVAAVVLHVSGYGYQKRGTPFWLLEGLRRWRRTNHSCRLFGIFHELFATGRVWNSSFWLSNAQKYVTRSIWDLCDAALATTSLYCKQLALWRPNMKPMLYTMPAFSNVGEPKLFVPAEQRPANMAVFGQAGVERIVYADPDDGASASLAESLGVLNIIDIGARNFPLPGRLRQIPITALGQLSPEGVSQRLMSCRFGLLNYDIGRLEKSGVFAAYAAHGVIPVCIGSQATPSYGLEEGKHFLRWPFRVLPKLGAMQDGLVEWYGGHSIAKHADLIGSWCVLGKKS